MNSDLTLREWLAADRFTLCMSSGFFGFFAHAGVVRALEEEELLPARVVGSSAGAMVAGLWASGVSPEVMFEELAELRRDQFWDPAPGMGLLRGRLFRERMEDLLVEEHFADCRVPLAISVFDVWRRRTEVLNRGRLSSAIVASCAFPGLFHPQKHGGRLFSDGGILDRPGLEAISPGERTFFHHLVSRSPWRRTGSRSIAVPKREGLVALVLPGLPRSGPFKLEMGVRAMHEAHERASRALGQPVRAAVVG